MEVCVDTPAKDRALKFSQSTAGQFLDRGQSRQAISAVQLVFVSARVADEVAVRERPTDVCGGVRDFVTLKRPLWVEQCGSR